MTGQSPEVRVVDQLTGRVIDTPEAELEYLREQNLELQTRVAELKAENDLLWETVITVRAGIRMVLAIER